MKMRVSTDSDDEDVDLKQDDLMQAFAYRGLQSENISEKEINPFSVFDDKVDQTHDWDSEKNAFTESELANFDSFIKQQKETLADEKQNQTEIDLNLLNAKQRKAFDFLINHCKDNTKTKGLLFMVQGMAGTGKSFFIKAPSPSGSR